MTQGEQGRIRLVAGVAGVALLAGLLAPVQAHGATPGTIRGGNFSPGRPAALVYGPDPAYRCGGSIFSRLPGEVERQAKPEKVTPPKPDGALCAIADSFLGWTDPTAPRDGVLAFMSGHMGLPSPARQAFVTTLGTDDDVLISERLAETIVRHGKNYPNARYGAALFMIPRDDRNSRPTFRVVLVLGDEPVALDPLPRRLDLGKQAMLVGRLQGDLREPERGRLRREGADLVTATGPREGLQGRTPMRGQARHHPRRDQRGAGRVAEGGGEFPGGVRDRSSRHGTRHSGAVADRRGRTGEEGPRDHQRGADRGGSSGPCLGRRRGRRGPEPVGGAERRGPARRRGGAGGRAAAEGRRGNAAAGRQPGAGRHRRRRAGAAAHEPRAPGQLDESRDQPRWRGHHDPDREERSHLDLPRGGLRQDPAAGESGAGSQGSPGRHRRAAGRGKGARNPVDPALHEVAQKYAQEMAAAKGKLPEERDTQLLDSLKKSYKGVNMLAGASAAPLEFAKEKKVLASGKALGVGLAQGDHPTLGRNTFFVVILFGEPREAAKPAKAPAKPPAKTTTGK